MPAAGCNRAAEELKQKAMGAATNAVSDKVNEVVSEKVAEAVLEKEGAKNAKVDIDKNGSSFSVTDKDGKKFEMAGGNAAGVSESDLGMPFYPGASMDNSKSTKLDSPTEFQRSATLTSSDGFDKIAGFYRDKLKAISGSKRFAEMADGTGSLKFMLADEKGNGMMMVSIDAQAGAPTTITLVNAGKRAASKPAK
jgi:hypothetical protein